MGAVLQLQFGEANLSARITRAWDPPLYDTQDTLPRSKAESKLKPFATFPLGLIKLPSGEGPLTLRATEIPGRVAIDLRRMTITLVRPD